MRIIATLVALHLIVIFTHVAYGQQHLIFLHHLERALARDLDELLTEIASEYNVVIDMVFVSDRELVERALVMAGAGVMPDIVRVDQAQIRALTVSGLLEDLTGYIEKERINLHDDFIPLSAEAFQYQGKQFAIPAEVSSHATFYNQAMFDEAGLPYPAAAWGGDTWTWDDMVTAARHLTREPSGTGTRSRYGIHPMGHIYFWPGLWRADWVTDDLSEFLGAKEHMVQILERIADLNRQELVGGSFARGTAGMRFIGNWVLDELRRLEDLDWELAAYPKGDVRSTGLLPNGFAIGRTSEHKDIAWQIIKFLTLDDYGVRRYTDIVTRIPSHRDQWTYYLESQEAMFPGKQHHVFVESLLYGQIWTMRFSPNWPFIDETIRSAWASVWKGEKSVIQAMEEVAPQINALLQEGLQLSEGR